jgi:hypothetical protein
LENGPEHVKILLRLAAILSYQRHQRLTAANTMAIVVSPINFLKGKMKKATWSSGFLTQPVRMSSRPSEKAVTG